MVLIWPLPLANHTKLEPFTFSQEIFWRSRLKKKRWWWRWSWRWDDCKHNWLQIFCRQTSVTSVTSVTSHPQNTAGNHKITLNYSKWLWGYSWKVSVHPSSVAWSTLEGRRIPSNEKYPPIVGRIVSNPTTRIPNFSSSVLSVTKIRMAISRKRKELSELCWCQNERKNSEYKKNL